MVAATGIGSGLDIESLVTGLVDAERVPAEQRLLQQEIQFTSELSALGTLQGAVSNVQASLEALSAESTFGQRGASSSDNSAVIAQATSDAAAGSFSVEVTQRAQSQSLASGSFTSPTEVVGEGTLTFRFGTTQYTPADPGPESYDGFTLNSERPSTSISINSSNNTLEGVRDAINDADIGVSAVILNDGSGYRLLLASNETGEANSLEIQVDDTGDGIDTDNAGLSRLAFNSSANNLSQTVAAQDAVLSVNGLEVTSASNSVEGIVDGVNLTLVGESESGPATITVTENRGAARSAIDAFVEAYNSFIATANSLTAFDAETGQAAALQGDFTARTVINQLRTAISGSAEGFNGPFSSLAEIGITTTQSGTLTVNNSRIAEAFDEGFDSIRGVFAELGSIDDATISVNGVGSETAVGEYGVTITQLATQGQLTGAAITAPTTLSPLTVDGDNDTLSLIVDGVTASVSLVNGDYESGEELAAALQSAINGAEALSDEGITVTVGFTAGNELEIRSDRFGSESNVEIIGTDLNTAAELGLSVAAGTAGVDVAGTIGGVAAEGNGQVLSGAANSAVDGISLTVTGGALGSRGSVAVSRGIAEQLSEILTGFLESDGLFDSRTEGIQSSVDRISDDRDALDLRLEALEARYRQQFTALDILLANIETTSSFLTQQLANIPVPGIDNSN